MRLSKPLLRDIVVQASQREWDDGRGVNWERSFVWYAQVRMRRPPQPSANLRDDVRSLRLEQVVEWPDFNFLNWPLGRLERIPWAVFHRNDFEWGVLDKDGWVGLKLGLQTERYGVTAGIADFAVLIKGEEALYPVTVERAREWHRRLTSPHGRDVDFRTAETLPEDYYAL